MDRSVREFPETGPALGRRGPANEKKPRLLAEDECDFADSLQTAGWFRPGNGGLKVLLMSLAEASERATVTGGRRRCTNQCPQFHQRLIEVTRPCCWEQPFRSLPQPLLPSGVVGTFSVCPQSCQNTEAVGLDDRKPVIEGLAENGPEDVATDTEPGPDLRIAREAIPMTLVKLPSSLMKVSSAAIITEPGPAGEHCLFIGGGQRLKRRESLDESPKTGNDSGNRGLLQHHLTDPDSVRIAILTPRQPTLFRIVPSPQQLVK